MKQVTAIVMAVLAGAAMNASAQISEPESLKACQEAISEMTGGKATSRLYGVHYREGGERLRLNVYPFGAHRESVNCWVDSDGALTLESMDGIALHVMQTETDEQITLVD